ncbi:MAG: hypothetical protein P1V97_38670, partial [Planctomycetota bacterium]|nr:hypothetical protein [Planctomycetota bacterium]
MKRTLILGIASLVLPLLVMTACDGILDAPSTSDRNMRKCGRNLSEIGRAMFHYTNDHGFFPHM